MPKQIFQKRVSVLIPTYNRSDLVAESVEAVISACRSQDEIIVLNDGSTDNTLDVLARFGDRIRIISTGNHGKSRALNTGLSLCRGDYVWIMDDDDLALPDALTRLLGLLQANPDAEIAYGRHERFCSDQDGSRTMMDTGYWCYGTRPENFLARTLDDFFMHQPGMIVRREAYARAGPFRATLRRSLDYHMLIRLASAAKVVGTDEVVFLQRVHDGSRGGEGAQFPAAERGEVWAETDSEIFSDLYHQLPLGAFTCEPGDEPDLRWQRRALLRRGVVMARHRNWALARKDFHRALILLNQPIKKPERFILRDAFNSKYGCGEILSDPTIIPMLINVARGKNEPNFTGALARGLVWHVRKAAMEGKVGTAAGFTAAIWRLWFGGRLAAKAGKA